MVEVSRPPGHLIRAFCKLGQVGSQSTQDVSNIQVAAVQDPMLLTELSCPHVSSVSFSADQTASLYVRSPKMIIPINVSPRLMMPSAFVNQFRVGMRDHMRCRHETSWGALGSAKASRGTDVGVSCWRCVSVAELFGGGGCEGNVGSSKDSWFSIPGLLFKIGEGEGDLEVVLLA